MTISQSEPQAPQTYSVPNAGGGTAPVNNAVSTVGAQVLAADPTRRSITFGNPNTVGNINLLVFQAADVNGNSLLGITFAAPSGGYPIVPGGILTITGDAAQTAWGAVAQTGNTNGITITTSRT